ncbi:MAG: type II toxin-antitoxin system RelE/ParE family toxin [Candidatus Electrothrix sp. AR1]|nr:type II toxin-antitoxin system RelE/ParE family toxin [Candidatus Electrothrix sp. AR1]
MKVTILDAAEKDLESGYHFYEKQAQGLGIYFLDSLYSDIDSLIFFGGTYRKFFGCHRLFSKRFPFAVYYRLAEDEILVTAIIDYRKSPSWTRKQPTGS